VTQPLELPCGVTLLERGWLSSNIILITGPDIILITGPDHSALIDSGYATHAEQTLALVAAALNGRALDVLVNTHLHSDHCGGNAAMQAHYPNLHTYIPPGQAAHVTAWNPYALSFTPTGQICAPFTFNATLQPNTEIELGGQVWQIHAAPGHDPNSVILFEPLSRLLLSADALWENGFGVVFPELDGEDAFTEVAQTLDLIESLDAKTIIPGHGPAFADVPAALARARKRLDAFVNDPAKHIRYAAKVLIKFKLLEVQRIEFDALLAWAAATDLLARVHQLVATGTPFETWVDQLVAELVRSGAAGRDGLTVRNVN
jgi:glyoxylase-like metal-dependent hydrolase (beta-lactamase superfamily II)